MSADKIIKIRRCVNCRKSFQKSELLRVVRTPEGIFEVDFTGKTNGRGAYVCKNSTCAVNAKKRRQFDKSFKTKIPDEIYEKIISAVDDKIYE